ncbi:MAG: hypothetical protein C0467_06635 [Planctomycetaceae bacterium]|nr:hypothetical protein [Planctomycetaceae bacterium]
MSPERFSPVSLARSLILTALLLGPTADRASAQIFGKNGPSLPSLPAPKPPKLPDIKPPAINIPKPPKLPDIKLPEVKPPTINVPKPPKIEVPTIKPPKFDIPTVKPPTINVPKPPKIDIPTVKPPTINIPKPPKIDVPDFTVLKPPTINIPKPPTINIPTIKIPPLITLKPAPYSTLPVEPDSPRPPGVVKPQNNQQLGNSVPGLEVPTKPKPPKPPVPNPNTGPKPPQPPIIIIPPLVLPPVKPQPQVIPPQLIPPQVIPPQPPQVIPPQPQVIPPQVIPPQPPVNPEPTPQSEPPAPETASNALRVSERVLDAAAAKAGIELGDILLKVGDQRVKTEADLKAALEAARGKLVVTYFNPRDNKVESRELTPDAGSIGVSVEAVTVDLQEEEAPQPPAEPEVPEGETAVQVTEVVPRSAAARAGIQNGDVIVAVNGKRVSTPTQLTAMLEAAGEEAEVVYVNPEDGKAETKKLKITAGSIGVKGRAVAVAEK